MLQYNTMTLFTRDQVLMATRGLLLVSGPLVTFSGISTDTRSLQPGELFIALRGENFNGHAYLQAAKEKGAAGALIEEQVPGIVRRNTAYGDWNVIEVTDTQYALGQLAQAHRRRFRIPVLAITGSTGKTTTKEMTAAILERSRPVLKTPANFNNEIGTPKTLFQLRHEHQALVLEFGMRGRGQIHYLATMARPTVGVITNVDKVHLELLGSLEEIALAKAELLDTLPADGVAVLPSRDACFPLLREHASCRVLTVGEDEESDFWVSKTMLGEDLCARFMLHHAEGAFPVRLAAPGRHLVWNALAAAAASMAVGAQPHEVRDGLAEFVPAGQRMQVHTAPGGFLLVDDSYNANPLAMRATLEFLAEAPGGRKVAVLGDMLELGPGEHDEHREIGRYARELGIDAILAVGERGRHYVVAAGTDRAQWYPDNDAAADAARSLLQPGDIILVKGSHGMHMEEIVSALLTPEEA